MLDRSRVHGIAAAAFLACLAACALSSAAETKPRDVVIVRDVMVPMRDGVKLATDPAHEVLPATRRHAIARQADCSSGVIKLHVRPAQHGFERRPLRSRIWPITGARVQPGANLFKAGHRLRVDICSSNFPNFDINRNTGQPQDRRWRIANNTIHHDAEHPSYIELDIFR